MRKGRVLAIRNVVALAVLFWGGTTRAASRGPLVELGAEDFWRRHDISLVVILDAPERGDEQDSLTVKVEKQVTGKAGPGTKTVQLFHGAVVDERDIGASGSEPVQGPFAAGQGLREVVLKQGDELVMCELHDNPLRVAIKLTAPAQKSALLQTVTRVAAVYNAGTEAGLKEGVASPDPLVVRYALNCLFRAKPGAADAVFAKQLEKIRDEPGRSVYDQLAINRLWPQYATEPEKGKKEAVTWLRETFENSREISTEKLYPFSRDLISSFATREERVAYFVGLTRDVKKAISVRQVAAGALSDEACFDDRNFNGELCSTAYSAILSLLNEDDAGAKKAGASLPWVICRRIPLPEVRAARIREAMHVLVPAIMREENEDTQRYMTAFRSFLIGLAENEPSPKPPAPVGASARSFNSKLKLLVFASQDGVPPTGRYLGQTPAMQPLAIPDGADWSVEPSGDVQGAALVEEINRQHIPGLLLNGTTVETIAALKNIKELKSVGVGGKDVTDATLASLKAIDGLQGLTISGPRMTDAMLAQAGELGGLRWLNLREAPVTNAGLVALKQLKGMESLNVGFTRITDTENLAELRRLGTLTLDGTQVTDAGVARLKNLKALRALGLRWTLVTDAGVGQLRELPGLQTLDLLGTPVTDAVLVQLKELRALRSLDLRATDVTDAGVAELQKTLPDCAIRYK